MKNLPLRRSVLPKAEAILPYLERIDATLWYSNRGPLSVELEGRLAELFGRPPAEVTLVANGTVALELPLMAFELPRGSRIAVPSFTFAASAVAVERCGHTPVFLDVDPSTWTLTPEGVEAALEEVPDLAAVMPVAAFGAPLDAAGWDQFEERTGIRVLLDCAWSFDTAPRCRSMVGMSLHATKVLGVGEGGIMLAPSEATENLRQRANFGFDATRDCVDAGLNGKMSEYTAAVGLAALDRWPQDRAHLLSLTSAYADELNKAGLSGMPGLDGTWATAAIAVDLQAPIAEEVRGHLAEHGIETRRWWGRLVHEMPRFERCPRLALPVSERLSNAVLNLPMSPLMDTNDVTRVVHTLAERLG